MESQRSLVQSVAHDALRDVCTIFSTTSPAPLPPPSPRRSSLKPAIRTRCHAPSCRGYQVIFIDTSKSDTSVDRTERVIALWYVMLTALQDVETQRRGVCFIVSFKNAKLSQVRSIVCD